MSEFWREFWRATQPGMSEFWRAAQPGRVAERGQAEPFTPPHRIKHEVIEPTPIWVM